MRPVELPAEWHENEACWLAWPSHAEEWLGDLEAPRQSVAALCAAIADVDAAGQARGERIELLVLDDDGEQSARQALGATPARFHRIPFGDIWLRDTGPIFLHAGLHAGLHGDAGLEAACFRVNGWGGKYFFPDDLHVGGRIADVTAAPITRHSWILEGGAIDGDGQGTILTTRQCLLNPNRNPGASQADLERWLAEALGARAVIWLDQGLVNDHTDGHVDTLARFVAPATVACMRAGDADDPNRDALDRIIADLEAARDAAGRPLEVAEVPSPGLIRGPDGEIQPASYMNFYIGNTTVVVPTYGSTHDDEAVERIAALFPDRRTVGVDARGVILGGGAFHCITRQQPTGRHGRPAKERA